MRLRTHLIALVLAALVPILGFAALVIRENARLQLVVTERGMRETARAVAHTVDATLDTAITALQALGESEHLDPRDLSAFHAQCQRVARAQGWTNILVFDPEGHALMNTSAPLGAPLSGTRRPAALAQARATRRPAVSDLFDGAFHRNIVAVYVPIVRDGAVRFVVSAALPAAELGAVLRAQQFGPDGVAVLQDRDNVIIARTQGEAETVGHRVQNPSTGPEGWTRSRLQEGVDVYVAFATAPLSGWRVALTVPVESVESPLRRAIWQMLAGAAVAAALAGGLAFLFGRRIAGAVGSLVRIARAVEGNRPSEPLRTGVTEVNALAEQLRAATDLARVREQEVAARERQARTIGEVARALNASTNLDDVLRTAVEAVRGLVGADFARIALVDEAGQLVLRYSTSGATAMPAGFVIERGRGIGGLTWATGVPTRTDDFAADPRFQSDAYLPIARADGIVSSMVVPIVTADAVAGVIYANNCTRRPFTSADEAALVTLAHHAAVAVQKARLLAGEHAARAEAEAASRGKDELLAMLGHELRNPLAAIASALHVVDTAPAGDDTGRRALAVIARQNTHLSRLVDDLLDVARVTAGKITLVPRPLELADAAQQALATLAASGRTERHRLTLDLKPVWSHVDPTRFEQVVVNLVSNALRFTPAGGTVDVVVGADGADAVLRVRDSGVGIPPEMLRRVFEPFVQGERGPDRGPGGLGLGLTLVRRIAELHGGSVEAASEGPGRGSTFTVRLPALPVPSSPLAPGPAAPGPSAEGPRRRILVVEDNADAREMLRLLLELDGHEVYGAADGPGGLEAAEHLRPDVALIDVGLPGFDGYELARRLRTAVGAAIHLVALTGYGQPEDRRRAHEAGFDAHLVKPVDPGALHAAIPAASAVSPRA
jgi:signal transduction histidine kinase/ActR/RegA family two-component response regulator